MGALFACVALGACAYDFDGLVARSGSGGSAGTSGAAGQGGSSGASVSDGGGAAGRGGTGMSGSSGTDAEAGGGSGKGGTSNVEAGNVEAGKGGTAGADAGPVEAGKGGTAGAGKGGAAGAADAASDRGPDAIGDARAEAAFDCTAVSGTAYQGHCYYPSSATITTDWDTANTTACAAPSHLAVITSAAEHQAVAAILPGKDRWIGLRKDAGSPNMESSFRWVTAEALAYKTWDSYDTGAPEPNYTGDCVRMRNTNNWGDTSCTDKYVAVCERE